MRLKKSDITDISSIYQMIIEQVTEGGATSSSSSLYDKLGQNLRENKFETTGGETIVVFYTKKISDDENDILHNASGPAVTFGSGGEGNEFYFIDGKLVEKDSKEFRAANSAMTFKQDVEDVGDEAADTDFGMFQ
jgi:hypothetical protein